jgi:hypothetical protein
MKNFAPAMLSDIKSRLMRHNGLFILSILYVITLSIAKADGKSTMLNLRDESTVVCNQLGNLTITTKCHRVEMGSLKIMFAPITNKLGLLVIEVRGSVDFLEVSTGRIFFFGSASGGVDPNSIDGDINIRNFFCLESAHEINGYAWDGGAYLKNDEATEVCPIAMEEK